ncbi:hypothetical protein PAPYR_8732 [Paratrimastix pyriformis]|uniref:Uncharacterized protein n=1 Tax=Paratrimastix pyriformis TaxID=342808 RepID=A0ABQ8U9Z3_9EUKA|nr:hypothetical protein PAPYR_8732 [Paratrimastix pyriformis]
MIFLRRYHFGAIPSTLFFHPAKTRITLNQDSPGRFCAHSLHHWGQTKKSTRTNFRLLFSFTSRVTHIMGPITSSHPRKRSANQFDGVCDNTKGSQILVLSGHAIAPSGIADVSRVLQNQARRDGGSHHSTLLSTTAPDGPHPELAPPPLDDLMGLGGLLQGQQAGTGAAMGPLASRTEAESVLAALVEGLLLLGPKAAAG